MKKEKGSSPAQEKKGIFDPMGESDMTAIDRKIHDLLTAEGYRVSVMQRFEGTKLNNYTNVNRITYERGERERVFVYTHDPQAGAKKTA